MPDSSSRRFTPQAKSAGAMSGSNTSSIGRGFAVAVLAAGAILFAAWLWLRPEPFDRNKVYVIGYGTDAPFHYEGKDGKPAGLAVELVSEAARRTGIKLAWITSSDYKVVDLFVLKTVLPERRESQHFTEPFLQTESWFVVLESSPYQELADLRGRRIGSVDYAIHRQNLAQVLPTGRLVEGRTSKAALEKLQSGAVDAVFLNEYALLPAIVSLGFSAPLRIIPAGIPRRALAISSKFEHAAVADAIRSEMRHMVEDGTISRTVGRLGLFPNLTADMIQELVAARRRTQRLVASTAALIAVTLATAWLAIRSRRQTVKLWQAERALKESEGKYRLAMDAVSDALWDWDVPSGAVYYSPAWTNLVGPGALAPTLTSWQQLIHPEDRAGVDRSLQDHLAGKTTAWSCEHRLSAGGDRWIWVLGRGQVISRGTAGNPTRLVGTMSDVSPRKAAETAVNDLNRQLEQRVDERTSELNRRVTEVENLNQELEAFSSSVSHDLRAPLRNIAGFVELLKRRTEGRLDAEECRYLDTVTRETTRMGRLINDLLALSKVGRTALKPERVHLADLLAETRAELESEIGARSIEWKIGALPDVAGDRTLLRQVFANLLGNAVKFTARRNPARIEIGRLADEPDTAAPITLFVRDNGAGFDPKYQAKLFGVFQRLHSQRDFEGLGIGLANVKRIVSRHGGRVWAEGAVNAGATFYFTLPAPPP